MAAPDEQPLPWFHPGVLLATGCGLGYLRPAPGTWGSLPGLPLAAWLASQQPLVAACVWVGSLAIGRWACRCGARHFGSHDPGGIVVDEYLAVPLAAAPLWLGVPWWLALPFAFGLFRLFDIVKAGPVGWADRLPGETGVMLDDLVAGLMAGAANLAACAAIAAMWPGLAG